MKNNNDNRSGRENLSKLIQRFDGIENNNPPTNSISQKKTGILYTSDWIDKLSYPDVNAPLENRYEEDIKYIDKLRREGEWVYVIELTFRAAPAPEPDYGENLINVNDFFTIKKVLPGIGGVIYNNDVCGYVKTISPGIPAIEVGYITILYTLTCVITEGDPYLVGIGDKFIWSRDEFIDDINALKNPPIKLEALKVYSTNAVLNWVDESCLAKSFVLRIRKNGSNLPIDIYYVDNIILSPTNVDGVSGNIFSYAINFVSLGILPGEWQWCLSSVFDGSRKDFSMWSNESLLIIK